VQPIVIAAGGTGGHFFPAEALASALVARGHRIVLMTDARSGGLKSPVFAGRETHVLSGGGVAGRGIQRSALAVAAIVAGAWQARSILDELQPGCIVGFGGYPSVAPIAGARLLRHRPALILHEQNAVLGRANRFLSRWADTLALSFVATKKQKHSHIEVTGNPVRPAVAALADVAYAAPTHGISVLVTGGSLGARVFSDVVPAALLHLPDALRSQLTVVQQARKEDVARVRAAYAAACIQAEVAPFFDDIAARLSAAHLVIARGGASTVAELAVAGRPSILVPLPGAIDDHQTANAEVLAAAGGSWVMPQPSFDAKALADRLETILSDVAGLANAAAAARTQGRSDAADRLADLVEAHLPHDATRLGEYA
jgi:UDP-N-acetylglucosamine--N-acetylmuramyl-(pentapeptide) pyrophosphoryl-undecaprenol N-acetylglucosamine transferase